MVRLKWDNEDSPMYQTGVSHGVFYGDDGVGHAWSGLVSVTEKPQNNAPTAVYNAMGEKYDNFGNVAEKKHGLACYVYPEVMDDYLGYEYLEDYGFTVDERPPKKFHMAYRVELGNGLYEIHVLLNQIATFGETARQTVADTSALSTITMNLEGAVDPRIGTSHIRLDSRLPITKSAEVLLFGDQYTDANIHEFLTAEPVWETVTTNYAPIIEPDYDNYVWLGGVNLVTDVVTSTPESYLVYSFKTSNDPSTGDVLTFSLDATYPQDRAGIYLWYNNGTSNRLISRIHASRGSTRHSLTFEYPEGPVVDFRVYSGSSNANFVATPGDTMLDRVKMEDGPVESPWIPALSDPNQKPRPIDPYPENYKPGVMGISPSSLAIPFYDEKNRGLGVYARVTGGFSYVTSRTIPIQDILGSYFRITTEVVIEENITDPSPRTGAMRVSGTGDTITQRHSTVGTHIGSYETNMHTSNITTGYDYVYFYHGAQAFLETITYRNPLATTSPTTEFFDANSTPPTKGDRYVRAKGHVGEYTLHQQLRLRTTAKVKLSDITQYDFWLEAADSMLLSQNETFTFNGPQAVIDGDTFTIDDSIQGYAEG